MPRSARCGRARCTASTRVAVIDFDVHHGNGTQACFWDDAGLFYASTHQSPLYPGTGAARRDRGRQHRQRAAARRCPGSREFRLGVTRDILPALDAFRPELVLISAGFDAHRSDPLAQLMLDEADYVWVTEQLLEIALAGTPGAGSSRRWRAATTCAALGRQRGGACPGADGGVTATADALLQSRNDLRYSRCSIGRARRHPTSRFLVR